MTQPPPGRFEGNESLEISEFLHDLTPSDELGEVEGFGWYGLIDELDTMFSRIEAGIEDAGLSEFFSTEGTFIDDIKPAYIVNEDNNGFFTYTGFDTNKAAREAWETLTEEYLEFIGNDDVEVSSE